MDRQTDRQTPADTNKGVVEVQAIRLRTNNQIWNSYFLLIKKFLAVCCVWPKYKNNREKSLIFLFPIKVYNYKHIISSYI